jgi:hypothetical protein
MRQLIDQRYASLAHHFPPQHEWALVCDNIWFTEKILEATEFDVKVAAQGFSHAPADIRVSYSVCHLSESYINYILPQILTEE